MQNVKHYLMFLVRFWQSKNETIALEMFENVAFIIGLCFN